MTKYGIAFNPFHTDDNLNTTFVYDALANDVIHDPDIPYFLETLK